MRHITANIAGLFVSLFIVVMIQIGYENFGSSKLDDMGTTFALLSLWVGAHYLLVRKNKSHLVILKRVTLICSSASVAYAAVGFVNGALAFKEKVFFKAAKMSNPTAVIDENSLNLANTQFNTGFSTIFFGLFLLGFFAGLHFALNYLHKKLTARALEKSGRKLEDDQDQKDAA